MGRERGRGVVSLEQVCFHIICSVHYVGLALEGRMLESGVGLVWLFVLRKEMVWVCCVGVSCFLLLHVNCTCGLS